MTKNIYENINKHIKEKFLNFKKTNNLDLTKIKKDRNIKTWNLDPNKIYKSKFICVAVDIVNSSNMLNDFEPNEWLAILSEYAYGIIEFFKKYNAIHIKIQGDSVFGVFIANTSEHFNNAFDCCVYINTFNEHLNKSINKYLNKENNIEFGIGAWYSDNNFLTMIGHQSCNDIVFSGDAVNLANKLSKMAGRNDYKPILLNNKLVSKFSKEFSKNNDEFLSNISNNKDIYESNAILIKYQNYIKNNL